MRARRAIRIGLIGFAALLALVVAIGAFAISRFNPNSFKPQITAAVEQATGRKLTLNGPISLHVSLWPVVQLRDVTLANPPGFSRPAMATLQRLDVQLALWPLLFHQVNIERLVLQRPDIWLETNKQGAANWTFQRPQPVQAKPAPQATAKASTRQGAMRISVDHLRIDNGSLSYRDDATGKVTTVALHRFDANAASPEQPLQLTADAAYDGQAFTLRAKLGPIARLLNTTVTTPWPVDATLQINQAKLSAEGSIRQPMQGRGYDLVVIGNIPDVAAFAPLLPGTHLPPLHDVRFSTRLRDQGKTLPEITSLSLQVGASDLSSIEPGLRLTTLDVSAPAMDRPMQLKAQAQLAAVPLQLAGTTGPLQALLAPPSQRPTPWPVDLTGAAAGAKLAVKGNIARPAELRGVDLQVSAEAPDLAALGPVLHRPLPAWKPVSFSARVTDGAGGFAKSVSLQDLRLNTPPAQLAGNITVAMGQPPDVTAKLDATRIDADALLAAFRPAAPPSAKAPAAPAPAPHPAASGGPLFPNTPLPFGLLRAANANIQLAAKEVISGGQHYRNISGHLVLRNGKLTLAPFNADLPQGHVNLTLSADGAAAKPPVALTLHAPGLALQPLLAALHQPAYATGNLEVLANLHGAGSSPHAIAADLNGTLGLAMEHGTVDAKLLEKLLGPVLAKANLLGMLAHGGTSQVQCFAFGMQARNGIGAVRALTLSSSLLSFDGGGDVNLGNETLDLNLRPQGRIGGTGFVVPLRVTGPMRNPSVAVNAAGAAQSNIGALAGAVAGGATPLGALGGVLIGGAQTGQGVSCAAPLAIARGQRPPAQPKPAAAPSPAPRSRPSVPNPQNLLKQLFR